jgi:hypothetical protein
LWQQLIGVNPQWLYCDSKVVPYPELSQLNQRGIWFVTIRRRGAAILRRLNALPASQWRQAVIDTAHRRHQRIRYLDETVQLPGYKGSLRQLAVTGLGREHPTLFLSNNAKESARALIVRYAGRNRVEDGLGISVNFFHVDCLASEVRLNVDLDTTMTVLANGCYRWLAKPRRGCATAAPQHLSRTFVATGGGAKSSRNGSSCPSTSAATPRSCGKPLSINRARRCPGCGISRWSSSIRELLWKTQKC